MIVYKLIVTWYLVIIAIVESVEIVSIGLKMIPGLYRGVRLIVGIQF